MFRRFEEAPVPTQRTDYVEVLHEGRYYLLKQYNKVLRKSTSGGAYSAGTRYDELEDKNTYYLRLPNATVVPVKLNIKALQSASPELASALKKSAAAKTAKTEAEWAAVLEEVDPR